MTVLTVETVQVVVDGQPLERASAVLLAEIAIDQRASTPACLTLTFVSRPTGEQSRLPELGSTIDCTVGDHTLFEGTVAGRTRTWTCDRGDTVAVRAYDRLHALRDRRRTMAYRDVTPVEVIDELAAGVDLEIEDRSGLDWPRRTYHQYGETDLAFLRRLLAPTGCSVAVAGGRLVITGDAPTGHATTVGPDSLMTLSVDERADTGIASAVSSWSPNSDATTGSGPADSSLHPGHVGSVEESAALVDGLERFRHRQRVVAEGIAPGDHRIAPGSSIDVAVAANASASETHRLLVATATHRVSAADGYTTSFSTEPTSRPPRPAPSTLTLGRVVDLDDPECQGRVRLSLLAFDGIETDWLAVVGLGSGLDRGVVAVPDLDDLAVVIGPLEDPAAGIVIGGLPAGSSLTGEPVTGGESRRIVARLPGGARLMLDPDTVELDDGRGSTLVFSEDHVRLHAAVDLELAAPGRSLVVTADTIDFVRS